MKTEKQKMLSGELYAADDGELLNERLKARQLLKAFNDAEPDEKEKRANVIRRLIPDAGSELYIEPPFQCDYGTNIHPGDQVYFNFNCVVLDVMPVKIGDRSMFGPNVQIYTASHPLDFRERAKGPEFGKAILIGEDVWIGGSVVICPGVSIGDRTVIGAGSVVTKDIPSDVFAAGNPCKVLKKINQDK